VVTAKSSLQRAHNKEEEKKKEEQQLLLPLPPALRLWTNVRRLELAVRIKGVIASLFFEDRLWHV
jgi:hypothetical protein